MVLTSAARWASLGLDQAGSDRTHSAPACVGEPEEASGVGGAFQHCYFSKKERGEANATLFDVQTFSHTPVSKGVSIFSSGMMLLTAEYRPGFKSTFL